MSPSVYASNNILRKQRLYFFLGLWLGSDLENSSMKSFENMTYLSTDPLFQPIQVNPKDVGVSFYRIADHLKSPGATWGHLGGRWVAFIRFIIAFVRSVNRPSFSIHPCETTNVGVSFSYHLTSPSLGQPSSSDLVICAKFFCQPRYMIIIPIRGRMPSSDLVSACVMKQGASDILMEIKKTTNFEIV